LIVRGDSLFAGATMDVQDETAGSRVPVTAGQPMAVPQSPKPGSLAGQSATQLPDGRVLHLGGQGLNGPTWTVSLYDPSTQTSITLPGRMFEARAWHTATILPDGGVLIVGGRGMAGELLSSAERFDPGTETFAQVEMPDVLPRAGHSATLLTDGRVLIVGGQTTGNALAGAGELWDVASHRQTRVADAMPRSGHGAMLLGDGRVLLAGGTDAAGRQLAQPEIFDPTTNRLTLVASRDLSSMQRLGRPRDRFIHAVRPLLRRAGSRSYWAQSLVGGDALQHCLRTGLIEYRLLRFARAPAVR